MDQDETWHEGRPRPRPQCVGRESRSPLPKGAQPPNFRPMSVVAKRLTGSTCHLVYGRWTYASAQATLCKMGTQLPQGAQPPQFSAHACCGQTAGWIKMQLGTMVGLGPGHIVLQGDPAPPRRGTTPPIFVPCLLWPNGRPSQLLLSTCFPLSVCRGGFRHVQHVRPNRGPQRKGAPQEDRQIFATLQHVRND